MSASDPVTLFGYGSLISLESLLATVPSAQNVRPAYIKGFRREFSKWDSEGWKSMYNDLAGIPFCAVDVIPNLGDAPVNGVVFEISTDYLAAMKRREFGYDLIATEAYDFETDKLLGRCFVFSAKKRDGQYVFGEPAQERYTQLCLAAAKERGDKFYQQFLTTTYVGDKTLEEIL